MQQDPVQTHGTSHGKPRATDSAVLQDGLLVVSPPCAEFACSVSENPVLAESRVPSGQLCAQALVRQCLDWLRLVENPGPVMLWLCWNESGTPAHLAQALSLSVEGLQNLWRMGPVRLQFESFRPGQLHESEKVLRTGLDQGADAAKNIYPCLASTAGRTDTMGVSMPQCPNYYNSDADRALGDEEPMCPQAGRVPTILLLDFMANNTPNLQCQPLLLSLPAPTPPCCDTLRCRKSPQQEAAEPRAEAAPPLWQPCDPEPGAKHIQVTAPDTTKMADYQNMPEELILDGVRYATLPQDGLMWRMGTTNPLWRQDLFSLPHNPDAAALATLAGRGLWIAPETDAPPLAVMCCGMGSVWPGMGRELYDNFPVARAAMDRIAAVADWDVLGLMDEKNVEKVSPTRWQSPYVFMLEFAQWSVLSSLGLKPSLFCGHSLGEMIALCFCGIYTPEVAWHILDTRAVHMAELEAAATREMGMMAVHASAEIIEEARATWPALYVSNYNTPQQFILSGPREVLMEARKSLRKRRIPAIVLNLNLAFHHPSMRVLRDLSLRRLNALEMHAPRHPMLGCTTTEFYPDDQPSICQHITDLDENSVRWTECVHTAWRRDGIRHFLELGPQDTLCSLVNDNEPKALCLTAGRKGKEVEGMRQTCARLYSLGHLRKSAIRARIADVRGGKDAAEAARTPLPHCGLVPVDSPDCNMGCATATPETAPAKTDAPASVTASATATASGPDAASAAAKTLGSITPAAALSVVLDVLARACGRPVEELRPDLDLRYDLALRSSRFPLIIQEVEKALDITVNFEDLLQVSTVGDLARVLGAANPGETADADTSEATRQVAVRQTALVQACAPLCRFSPVREHAKGENNAGADTAGQEVPPVPLPPLPLPLDPCGQGLAIRQGDILALLFFDPDLLPSLMNGLAPLGCVLAVPRGQVEACAPLARAGSRIVPFDLDMRVPQNIDGARSLAQETSAALDALAKKEGRVGGLIFAPAASDANGEKETGPAASATAFVSAGMPDLLAAAMRSLSPHGLRYACLCSLLQPTAENLRGDGPLEKKLEELGGQARVATRGIRLLEKTLRAGLNDWGDMLARELLHGTASQVIWVRPTVLPVVAASAAREGGADSHTPAARNRKGHGLIILEKPRDYPLVFPDPQPPYRATSTLFQGCCHYSRFADPDLTLHGGQPGNALDDMPWLPPSRALAALLEASSLWLPWLTATGFSDLRFYDLPSLPPGITRECRVAVEAEPWIMQDGVMTRQCRSTLDVQELSANGRHLERYAPVAEGMTILAAANGQVPPLWPHDDESLHAKQAQQTLNTGAVYDSVGFGAPWRMLENFTILPNHRYTALLDHTHASIAPEGNKGYKDVLYVVEGMAQAAWMAITQEAGEAEAIATVIRNWRLHAAGFIRFGGERGKGPWRIMMRRSWSAPNLLRYDGQAIDESGRVFLTLHHLEFNRRDTGAAAL
ncbi:MAG: acyltransferase domain-containing protein [Desulfovibrio sp.]|nr:acyltransferase domain-containing protein [Desulfovibrio sp.]